MSTAAESAAAWAKSIAYDDAHGYDQGSRWGPDYDCSSLVISAWKKAGVPLTCTFTGNMRVDMLSHGFADVTAQISLSDGAGLMVGDVLLQETHHTAIYIGAGRTIHARGNELGGVTGGRSGDQTGREICEQAYFNYPWDCVLRYGGAGELPAVPASEAGADGTYTVRSGDMLGLIALRFGTTIQELARLNNLADVNRIYPGQVLKLPGSDQANEPEAEPEADLGEDRITAMARDVIAGKYGNGIVRVLKLGKDYETVQAEVNRLLAGQ